MATVTPMYAVNGEFQAPLSPLDRGLAYGDGLFETCLLRAGRLPFWQAHLARLRSGGTRLQIPLPTNLDRWLAEFLEELARRENAEGVVKLVLTRGQGGRGYRAPASPEPTLVLSWHPLPDNLLQRQTGVKVRLCRQRLAINPSLAGIKHLNRLEQVLARAEWQDEFHEGLLQDTRGRVIEGTASNLFVVHRGRLRTPDLSDCGVSGVMRQTIIDTLAPARGLSVVVAEVTLDQLLDADELILCNSVGGIWPVLHLSAAENRDFARGPITRQLQTELARVLDGGVQ